MDIHAVWLIRGDTGTEVKLSNEYILNHVHTDVESSPHNSMNRMMKNTDWPIVRVTQQL